MLYDNMGQAKNQKEVDAILKRKPGSMNALNASGLTGSQMMTQVEGGSMIQSKQGTGRT